MFKFSDPIFFVLLIPLLISAALVYRRRIRAGILYAPAHRLVKFGRSWRTTAGGLFPLVCLSGLVLCILALARPQSVLSVSTRSADVIAIQMVVDVSGSMRALDLSDFSNRRIVKQRTRLDVVKRTFAAFIETRPEDLIGLVTFGGFASTRCPLTMDHAALLHVLEGVRLPRDHEIIHDDELSTAIGDGLATASARMRETEAKSRIIVLLSDGESNTGLIEPEDAVRAARELGIKVYTIGVGTTGTAPVMGKDSFGRPMLVDTEFRLDEDQLRLIAEQTGGRYFNARDTEGLETALTDIDRLERTTIEREMVHQHKELFPLFLIPGLILVASGIGLNMMVCRRII